MTSRAVSSTPRTSTEEIERLERHLVRYTGRCVGDFALIEEGDRIMVCLSGGKDSYTMMHVLERMRRKSPVKFELLAVHLDQGHPGYDGTPLEGWLKEQGFAYKIVREDTYSVVIDKLGPKDGEAPQTYCSLCSRLRRGILYSVAADLGCTKIALGHHREDSLETLMLNLMFTGSIKAMPPKLISDDQRNVVIRPLLYCPEHEIARFAELMRFPILPCDLCGSQENLMRKQVKNLLGQMEALSPRVKESMLGALSNVRPTHLFDRELWSRLGIHGAQAEPGESPFGGVSISQPSADGPSQSKRLPVLT